MARSIRFVRPGVQGRVRQNFNWDIISARSVVHITAAEVKFGTTQTGQDPPLQDFFYFLGEEANVWISNIGPHRNEFSGEAGGVEFHINVDSNSPIDVAVTITVEDNLPEEIQGF
jgi:hypothetical protein